MLYKRLDKNFESMCPNRIIMYLVVCLTLSCYQENARYPIDHAKKSFFNNSAERNKLLLAREEIMIKKALEKENSLSFMLSEKGFFYAYMNKSYYNKLLPIKGDRVVFKYKIEDLEKKIIYGYKELGIVEYFIDEENLLPALREGIRLMKPGEKILFLFPSYLCYGYQGDGQKIGNNQPLRFTIERLNQ